MAEPRILVIEDHLDTLQFYSTYLSLEGFAVTTATNGHEALRLAPHGFEAITTDLAMPGMDGAEFIRQMRAVRTKPPIPIVVVTGQADTTMEAELEAIGSCRMLTKPCHPTLLAQLLRTLIDTCGHQCDVCPNRTARAVGGGES